MNRNLKISVLKKFLKNENETLYIRIRYIKATLVTIKIKE